MTQDAAKAGPLAVAYTGAPRGRKYEAWREEFCRDFCQLDVEPSAAAQIECTIEFTQVGTLSFGAARGTSGSFLRTRSLLSDGCDNVVLLSSASGEVHAVHRGREVVLRPSEMFLMSMDDLATTSIRDGSRFTALGIPRRDLLGLCRDAEDRLGRTVVGSQALRDVVAGYFALCAGTGGSLDAIEQTTMARHMVELAGLLLRADRDEASLDLRDGYGAARLQLIQAQVLKRLSDGDLSITTAAQRAGLTPKQLQRLFATTGMTFSEFVLDQRLLLARRLLADPGYRREKIAAIALDAGFGDLSYFNRTFRKRFGMTPSEWREGQSGDA